MKIISPFLLIALATVTINAQNITSTLGPSGTYIVEDDSNSSLFRTSRATTPRIILGDYNPSFVLPSGDVDFVHNEGSDKINIVVGKGNAFSAFPKLQFYYTPGPLEVPTPVVNNSTLGIINFFGYTSLWGSNSAAFIESQVDGSVNGTRVPGDLTFGTQDNLGNISTLNISSSGVFTINPNGVDNNTIHGIDGSITAENLKGTGTSNLEVDANGKLVRGSGNISNNSSWNFISTATYSATDSDYTIIGGSVNPSTTITLPDPTGAGISGKTYVIKRDGANSDPVIINSAGTGVEIDGSTSITLNSDWAFIKVQAVGLTAPNATTWIIIGGENFTRN